MFNVLVTGSVHLTCWGGWEIIFFFNVLFLKVVKLAPLVSSCQLSMCVLANHLTFPVIRINNTNKDYNVNMFRQGAFIRTNHINKVSGLIYSDRYYGGFCDRIC